VQPWLATERVVVVVAAAAAAAAVAAVDSAPLNIAVVAVAPQEIPNWSPGRKQIAVPADASSLTVVA